MASWASGAGSMISTSGVAASGSGAAGSGTAPHTRHASHCVPTHARAHSVHDTPTYPQSRLRHPAQAHRPRLYGPPPSPGQTRAAKPSAPPFTACDTHHAPIHARIPHTAVGGGGGGAFFCRPSAMARTPAPGCAAGGTHLGLSASGAGSSAAPARGAYCIVLHCIALYCIVLYCRVGVHPHQAEHGPDGQVYLRVLRGQAPGTAARGRQVPHASRRGPRAPRPPPRGRPGPAREHCIGYPVSKEGICWYFTIQLHPRSYPNESPFTTRHVLIINDG
jgi:hypothetical protein